MKTTTPTRQPRLIRRVTIAAREGAMQCPRCSYALSYSDVLLCRVGETHYCPRCWSRIPNPGEFVRPNGGGPLDAGAGTATDGDAKMKDDDEEHVVLP
jgi:hypothetical protein